MDFRILGPLEVRDGGVALALGGPRQRLVLALLILEANHVVPAHRLVDSIWGDEPPDAARNALFAYVSRLRKLLAAERIQARPPGYILVAERREIDALRFADLVNEAHARADDLETTSALLAEGLDLWRGDALSDLADQDAARPAITRLEEQRLVAVEDRIEAEIGLGRHREAVAILETLTSEHPFRERLWSQLILALYRSGRQADALGAFHRARTTLVEELGIDPSPELRRLHERVIRQDPELDLQSKGRSETARERVDDGTEPAPSDRPAAIERKRGTAGRRLAVVGGAVVVSLLSAAVAWSMANSQKGLPRADWAIGLDMPLSGPGAERGQQVRDAVRLAIDDVNASGGIAGSSIELLVLDDAGDPAQAAANARQFVNRPTTMAMIGPWGSAVTFPVLPITNEAGLLQCSPAATHPGLTKPRYGALDLRAPPGDAVNFVRLAPSDDIQATALAAFAYRELAARSALVINDIAVGRDIADAFDIEFTALGGSVVRRALNPGADPRTVLAPLADELDPPGLVFFGGEPDIGASVRLAMSAAGRLSTPLLSWDFLFDGPGTTSGSYIQRLGPARAVGSFVAHASLPDHKFSFADAYRTRFGREPDEYAAAGHACVEIVVAATRGVAQLGPPASEVRELVRAYAVDPGHRYETVVGTVGFDVDGDALQQFVTFYRVEPSAAGGAGDWVLFKKQDFGPAP